MNTHKKGNYVLPIIMMFALFFMISFVTGFQNPFGVIVKKQFEVSNLMSQLGNFANFFAYLFMGIPSGMLLQKKGYKFTALAAVTVGFVGVGITFFSGIVESFAVYLAGAFISGFAMCMLNAVVNPMLNTLGGGGKTGNQLIQFGGSINSIGATIVPVLAGFLIGDIASASIEKANPALFIAMGIFAITFVVLFAVDIPEPHATKDDKMMETVKGALGFRHFILGAIAVGIYVGIEVGIPNFINLFLTEKADMGGFGMDTTMAGAVVGTYWFLMMIGRICGGIVGGKVSPKLMLVVVSTLALMFVLIGIYTPDVIVSMPVFKSDISFGLTQVPMSVLFFALCGLCTSVMWGGIFNLAVEGLGKYTPAASGIFMTMVFVGGVIPLFQGVVADYTSFISSYWVIIASLAYIVFFALVGSKNVNTKN